MSDIKIRAREQGGITEIKALMVHPMETGTRKDSDGNVIPMHHITEVTVEHNGKVVMHANWGAGVSRNPYLAVKFKGGAKGDTVRLSWIDNLGEQQSVEDTIN